MRRPLRPPTDRKEQSPRKGGLFSKVLRAVGVLFLCLLVAGIAFVAGGYLGLINSVKKLEEPRSVETHPTYIYSAPLGDRDGSRRVIGTVFEGENRKVASLTEMPPHLLNAAVAKEDERFREHGGVDLWGIMRALYVDIRAGEVVEGASTITQQYVRNAYLSREQSIERKVKEALIAIEIERSMYDNKDQIIADYLNTAYFGNNAYGVEAATETYFNKSVEDLTVAESATLVGLLWSPSTLGEDREAARYQRDLVLRKMFDTGYIPDGDYYDASEEPMPDKWPVAPTVQSGLSGPSATLDFAKFAHEELIDKFGANTVLRGGLSVYTTIELERQVAAREVLYGPSGYLPNPEDPDLALVSIEPGTEHIEAMVGNRDPNAQFNLVTQGRRQPGSSFKPFAFIAALEQGIDPETEYVSEKKTYMVDIPGTEKPEEWKVQNYDRVERGSISLKEALWYSDNTVFTDLIMNVEGRGLKNGPAKTVDVARRLGVETDFGRNARPSVVLGTQEVSPLDMATAYATIANGGRRVEPTAISRVVSDQGRREEKVLYEAPANPEGEQVIDKEIAHEVTEVMVGDVKEGIAEDADLGERPVAGKTGTSERFFDAWFIGYTPQLVTGIWMGYGEGGNTLEYVLEYGRALQGLDGGITPAQIWKTYTERILDDQPIKRFEGVEMPKEDSKTPKPPTRQTLTPGQDPATVPGAVPAVATNPSASPLEVPAAGTTETTSPPPTNVAPTVPAPSATAPSSPAPSSVAPASVAPSSAPPR